MSTLSVGDPAPLFTLSDQEGRSVSLQDFQGKKLLIYFYPRADTPGCTKQSCDVRDHLEELQERGVAVLGISPDPPERQRKFDDKYSLGFPLLADTEKEAAVAYGVWREKKLYGKVGFGIVRSSFLVNEEGRLAGVWYRVKPLETVPRALALLEKSES